jgi:D-3-phosphoglycerate dehydrogenase
LPTFKVLYTDRTDYKRGWDIEKPIYDAIDCEIVDAKINHNAIDRAEYDRYLADADAVVCFRVPVGRRDLEAAPKLKVAVRAGVGYENFDLQAFTDRGIPCCNVPDYGTDEVAVHALTLILTLKRRVLFFDRQVRAGQWRNWPGYQPMHRLSTQTVGIIGLGRIGSAFAQRARALFGRVLACDPYVPASAFAAAGATSVPLDELLRESDAVTIHTPLTDETHHLIGARELRLMKPNAVFVNTARGLLVDQLALAEALEAGVLEGAACDVWEVEPADVEHPLLTGMGTSANFIATPHVAGTSVEGEIDNRTKQAQEVARVLRGEPPRNRVNP